MTSLYHKWLPSPVHTLILWSGWLILHGLSAGHFVLGGILAWLIPLYTQHLSTNDPIKLHKPFVAIRYIFLVLWDIVKANLDTLPLIFKSKEKLTPGLIAVPVELNGNLPKTMLASTISLTPGTVSLDYTEDGKTLYVHVMHMEDGQEIIDEIKVRYEAPLKEIFAC